MNSQTFVTDPLIWERFYKNMAKNKFNPYQYRRFKKHNQSGRGLHGRFRHSYMIPVNPNAIDTETNSVNTTMVSPVAAAEERATSELKNVTQEKKPHVKVPNHIKKRKKKKKLKVKKSSKSSTSKTNKTKKNKNPRKRKIGKDFYDSVWNQPSTKKQRR